MIFFYFVDSLDRMQSITCENALFFSSSRSIQSPTNTYLRHLLQSFKLYSWNSEKISFNSSNEVNSHFEVAGFCCYCCPDCFLCFLSNLRFSSYHSDLSQGATFGRGWGADFATLRMQIVCEKPLERDVLSEVRRFSYEQT